MITGSFLDAPEPNLSRGLDNPDHANWNPEDYVPYFYVMDPKTETLLPGSELTNHMAVLAENTLFRSDPGSKARHIAKTARGEGFSWTAYDEEKLVVGSRWCTITKLTRPDFNGVIRFIGVYEDGTMFTRTANQSYSWYVKKDTIGLDNFNIDTGKRRAEEK